jgi:hypothetical protein
MGLAKSMTNPALVELATLADSVFRQEAKGPFEGQEIMHVHHMGLLANRNHPGPKGLVCQHDQAAGRQ